MIWESTEATESVVRGVVGVSLRPSLLVALKWKFQVLVQAFIRTWG